MIARRALAAFAAFLPLAAFPARDFVDDAGRKVSLPDKVTRVYAAGPPASVLVFALAPDTLIGWTRGFRDNEKPWVPDKYANLPELGRLTGTPTPHIDAVYALVKLLAETLAAGPSQLRVQPLRVST